jgi:hypothetical protein
VGIMSCTCVVITLTMLKLGEKVLTCCVKILSRERSRGGTH